MRTETLKCAKVWCFAVLLSAWIAAAAFADENWRPLPFGSGGWVTCVAVDSQHPNVVFAGCDIGGVYKSADYGDTWRIMNKGLDKWGYQCVATIAMDPARSQTLYIGVGTWFGSYEPGHKGAFGGVYKSTDGGESWQLLTHEVKFGGHAPQVFRQYGNLIAIDPQNPDTFYAGSLWDGVFRSDDAGKTWRNLGLKGELIKTLALHPQTPNVVLVGSAKSEWTKGGLFRSEDGGRTWQEVLDAETRGIAVSALDPQVVYACCWAEGVYKSTDGGVTWYPVNEGLIPGRGHRRFRPVAVDPTNPDVVYVSSAETGSEPEWRKRNVNISFTNVHKSTDGGRTWRVVPQRMRDKVDPAGSLFIGPNFFARGASALAIDPQDPRRVYLCDWVTLWRSDDAAENWRFKGVGLETTGVFSAALHPSKPGVAYIGWGDNGFGYSVDGGKTFRATFGFGRLHFACDIHSIAVDDSSEPATLYAATSRPDGVFKSPDGGETWDRLTNGLPDDAQYSGQNSGEYAVVQVDPHDARVVYAGGRYGILRSADKGASWQRLPIAGLCAEFCCRGIVIDPKNPNVLYARGDGQKGEQGIYKSADGGQTWKSVSAKFPFVYKRQYRIAALVVDPHDPQVLYAGQAGRGVWKSADGGESWENVLPGLSCCGLAVDPVDSTVYAGACAYWYDRTKQGLYKSTDRGRTWKALDISGLGHGNIKYIIADPHVRGRLWVNVPGNGSFVGSPGEIQ